MPLQKQIIDIPVSSSIDTKTDEFLTTTDGADKQENVRFSKTGAIIKRPGYDAISATSLPGAYRIISDNQRLYVAGNTTVDSTYQYFDDTFIKIQNDYGSTSADDVTQVKSGQVELLNYLAGVDIQGGVFSDFHEDIHCVGLITRGRDSSEPSRIPQFYVYRDNKFILLATLTYASPLETFLTPTCIVIKNINKYVIVTARSTGFGGYLKIACYNLNNKIFETNISTPTIAAYMAATNSYDRKSSILVFAPTTTTIRLLRINETGIINDVTVTIPGPTIISGILDVYEHTSSVGIAVLATKADYYPVVIRLTSSFSLLSVWAESSGTIPGLGSISGSDLTGAITHNFIEFIYVFSGVSTIAPSFTILMTGNGPFSLKGFLYNQSVFARPIAIGVHIYIPTVTRVLSGETSSVIIFRYTLTPAKYKFLPVAYAFYDEAINSAYMSKGEFSGPGTYTLAVIVSKRREASFSSAFSVLLKSVALLNFSLITSSTSGGYQIGSVCSIGDNLLTFDGCPSYWEGSFFAPMSFFFNPVLAGITFASGGPGLSAGTYKYKIYYELLTPSGKVIRSEESNVLSITTTATGTINLFITPGHAIHHRAKACILRTKNAGTVFYVIRKVDVDITVSSFIFNDATPDSAIDSSTLLSYTEGGVLENTAAPPTLHATIHNNRIWCVPADAFNKIYYSKKIIENEVPAFNVFQYVYLVSSVKEYSDKIVGVSSLSDRLIIFRERSIYFLAGDGVNELGANDTFNEPELITSDLGCSEPRSIVETPVGVMFKSQKGIYLLTPGFELKHIGSKVEAYNNEEIRDAKIDIVNNIVKYATANRILCYDYYFDKWSIDTISGVLSLGIYNNKTVVLRAPSDISVEKENFYLDNFASSPNTDYSLKFTSSWLKLTSIQGYARVYRVLILGRYYSAHSLAVNVYYDYDTSYVESYTITPSPTDVYQYKIHLKKQKCQSLKIEITETPLSGTRKSCEISSVSLEIGVKYGSAKIATNKQA